MGNTNTPISALQARGETKGLLSQPRQEAPCTRQEWREYGNLIILESRNQNAHTGTTSGTITAAITAAGDYTGH